MTQREYDKALNAFLGPDPSYYFTVVTSDGVAYYNNGTQAQTPGMAAERMIETWNRVAAGQVVQGRILSKVAVLIPQLDGKIEGMPVMWDPWPGDFRLPIGGVWLDEA